MALRIQCPGCQALLQIGDECRGKQVRCGRCNNVMLVPGTTLPPQMPARNPSPPPAVPKPPPMPAPDAFTAAKPPPAPARQAVTAEKGAARKAVPPPLPPMPQKTEPREEPAKEDRPAAAAETRPAARPWIPPALRPWLPAAAFGALLLLALLTDTVDALVSPPDSTAIAEHKTDVKTSNYPPKIDDNPRPEPPKIDNNPRDVPPPPKLVELPAGAAPADITPETTRKVKKATAYMRVTLSTGQHAQGSGFFAAESGLVFTNAHVLGMMGASSPRPKKVEVVVNSGEPDEEFTLVGEVVGVDQLSDLGVVRVKDEAGRWPAPLPVDTSQAVTELQKVYVFGFPFGAQLGKNITINPSSVSSRRRGPDGSISQLQVNGGISPGNSGGPVVDSRGVVVGVAVGIMKGTPIGFAVPGEKLLSLLRGRVTRIEFGEPYWDNAVVRLPVHVQCMDPLQRIRNLKAEVWKGKPGPARPSAVKAPEPKPDDSARVVVPLTFDGTRAVGELVVPAVGPTEVLWLQPALTDGGGTTSWARAAAFSPSDHPPLERKSVVLQQQLDNQRERTLKLSAALQFKAIRGGVQLEAAQKARVEALEIAQTDPRGGKCNITIGSCNVTTEMNGQAAPTTGRTQELLRGKYFGFVTSSDGALLQSTMPLPIPGDPDFDVLVGAIADSIGLTCVSMPNRQVKPGESWDSHMSLMLNIGIIRQVVDVHATCTFEGSRMHQGQEQALIRMSGLVRGRGAAGNVVGGKVTGKIHFGVAKGYALGASVRMEFEFAGPDNSEGSSILAVEGDLARVPGNVLALTPAKPALAPSQVKRGKAILQKLAVLNNRDPVDYPNKADCYYKVFPVQLTAGKTYIIEMNRLDAGPPTPMTLDPYLMLHDPTGKKVAEDDDSGGNLNSLILFQPPTTGTYQIHATTFQPRLVGTFRLTVTEGIISGAPGNP